MKTVPLPKLLKKAQDVFNRFIRERDKDAGCISCGGPVEQAGHFFSQGHHSALRYNEQNTNGQCRKCNLFLSGNLIYYRIGLVKRIGSEAVENLERMAQANRLKKWSREELNEIINKYKNK
jgi:hypothetical protein